jgi:hypothetical protein
MFEFMRDAVIITAAGIAGGTVAMAVGLGVESVVAWL